MHRVGVIRSGIGVVVYFRLVDVAVVVAEVGLFLSAGRRRAAATCIGCRGRRQVDAAAAELF